MAAFIRNLFLFVLTLAIILTCILGATSVYMNRSEFKIDRGKNILVIGDSHTECAIDDHVFKRAVNLSKSATSYVYTYPALRKLITDNPHVDTVLLSYHAASLLYEREKTWIFDEAVMARQVPVFLPYFTFDEYRLFLFEPSFYKQALQAPWKALDYYKLSKKGKGREWIDRNFGKFLALSRSQLSKDTASRKPLDMEKRDPISQVSLKYIRKISDFCNERDITLILLNTPLFRQKKYVKYQEFEENTKKYLDDILFLDYAEFPIPDSCRYDVSHLNRTGAKIFSSYLDRCLAKDLKKQNHLLK